MRQFETALVSIDELGGVVIALVGRTFLLEVTCSKETALNLAQELCNAAGPLPTSVATG